MMPYQRRDLYDGAMLRILTANRLLVARDHGSAAPGSDRRYGDDRLLWFAGGLVRYNCCGEVWEPFKLFNVGLCTA